MTCASGALLPERVVRVGELSDCGRVDDGAAGHGPSATPNGAAGEVSSRNHRTSGNRDPEQERGDDFLLRLMLFPFSGR